MQNPGSQEGDDPQRPPAGFPWAWPAALASAAALAALLHFYFADFPFSFRSFPDSAAPRISADAGSAARSGVDLERLRRAIATLSGYPSRVTGYPGADSAAAWIEDRFRRTGLQSVTAMPFELPVPLDRGARLVVQPDGPAVELFCLWPNLVRTPTLPPGGISGRLVYGGHGELSAFNGLDVAGQLVLMEFDSGMNWINAFDLGASAVLFLEPEKPNRTEAEQKFLSVPADLPRFWVPRRAGETLKNHLGQPVHLTARMDWANALGRHILGVVEGSDPELRGHALVLEAYYDAASVVPARAPGAGAASGVAVLLEVAREFAARPPARTVVFVASGGHFQALIGMRQLVALMDGGERGLAQRRSRLTGRLRLLEQFTAYLEDGGSLPPGTESLPRLVEELADTAARVVAGQENRLEGELEEAERVRLEAMLEVARPLRWIETAAEMESLFRSPALVEVLRRRLAEEMRDLRQKLRVVEGQGRFLAVLDRYRLDACLGLDLSAGGDRVGIFGGGGFYDFGPGWAHNRNTHGDSPFYERVMAAGKRVEDTLAASGFGQPPLFFDGIQFERERLALGGHHEPLPFNGGPLNAWGFLTATLATLSDTRSAFDTPLDRAAGLDLSRLGRQAEFLLPFLREAAGDPRIAMIARGESDFFGYVEGRTVYFDPHTGFVPDAPVPHSLVRLRLPAKTLVGVRTEFLAMADRHGRFRMPGVIRAASFSGMVPVKLEGYHLDPVDGSVDHVADLGVNGAERYPLELDLDRKREEVSVVLFEADGMTLFEALDHRYLDVLNSLSVMEEGREVQPVEFGYTLPLYPYNDREAGIRFDYNARWVQKKLDSLVEPCVTVFAPPGTRIKIAMTWGFYGLGNRLLLLNSTPETAIGEGFPVSRQTRLTHTAYRVARDISLLNDSRIDNLRRHGVRNERLGNLHDRALDYLDEAGKALEKKEYDRFGEMARRSWTYASRAYLDVHGTTGDVVKGVLFYMALLIPFAWFGERLLLAGATIRRQLLGLAAVFLAAFGILRWVHPAFDLALNPGIILLGFIIFGLSVLVIRIGLTRMQRQIRKVMSRVGGVHRADMDRSGAVWSAFDLGINNMRRRPLRTLLAMSTIVLVTFSVLGFTSVKTFLRFNRVPAQGPALYDGLLVRQVGWAPVNAGIHAGIANQFRDQTVSPRAWFDGTAKGVAGVAPQSRVRVERLDLPDRSGTAMAVLGLTAQEAALTAPQRALYAGRWFEPGEEQVCILPLRLARQLRIGPADAGIARVVISGEVFTVVGLLDEGLFDNLLDLGNAPLTPLDPDATQPPEKTGGAAERALSGKEVSFVHLAAEQAIVVPYAVARRWGGSIRSVAIGFSSAEAVGRAIEDWMAGLAVNMTAGIDGRRYLLNAVDLQSVGGLGNIIVPLVIGALIVLNTMLGSVYERREEINTYTAVGLSPLHVAGLFVAEAAVYASFGAVLGYLAGQLVATVVSSFDLVSGLTLNYSSLSVVYSIALVMGMVLLSSLYPASMAFRVAASAVQRKWILPPAVGDELSMTIPVTVRQADVAGLMAYLTEYFALHEEQTVGAAFYTRDARYERLDTPGGAVHAVGLQVWLAPFDLNVSQRLELQAVPGQEDVYEVEVQARRASGDRESWLRKNYAFFNDLRKQFLIWRAIGDEARQGYEGRAAGLAGRDPRAVLGI